MSEKGKFIVIEGGDFCGKTEFQKQLARVLEKKGLLAETFRLPGGDVEGEKIRELLINTKLDATTRACIFGANRVHDTNQIIKPTLEKGGVVISTRWRWSVDVYQDAKPLSDFIDKNGDVANPDLYILLECTENVMKKGLAKRKNAKDLDLLDVEHTQDYEQVRDRYRAIWENHSLAKCRYIYNKGEEIPSDEEFEETYKNVIDFIISGMSIGES